MCPTGTSRSLAHKCCSRSRAWSFVDWDIGTDNLNTFKMVGYITAALVAPSWQSLASCAILKTFCCVLTQMNVILMENTCWLSVWDQMSSVCLEIWTHRGRCSSNFLSYVIQSGLNPSSASRLTVSSNLVKEDMSMTQTASLQHFTSAPTMSNQSGL